METSATLSRLSRAPGRTGLKSSLVTFATHLICIGMLFILPEMIGSYGHRESFPAALQALIYCKSLVFIAVFYINYYFIIGRAFEQRGFKWRLVVWNVLVVVAALVVILWLGHLMEPYWHQLQGPRRGHRPPRAFAMRGDAVWIWGLKFVIRDIVMLVLTIGLSVALKLSDSFTALERRSREIDAARQSQELDSLKQQLNPHFLFNTLNSIYALIAVSPDRAQEAVHELSGMLRYVLYDTRQSVEVSREFAFVGSYLQLMSLRLAPGQLQSSIDTDGCDNLTIAPLLFIPLIENTFKHGNTGNPSDTITITLTASAQTRTATLITSNVIAPRRSPDTRPNGGIGLQNLRRRLELIYGSAATLTAGPSPSCPGRFITSLTVPLK